MNGEDERAKLEPGVELERVRDARLVAARLEIEAVIASAALDSDAPANAVPRRESEAERTVAEHGDAGDETGDAGRIFAPGRDDIARKHVVGRAAPRLGEEGTHGVDRVGEEPLVDVLHDGFTSASRFHTVAYGHWGTGDVSSIRMRMVKRGHGESPQGSGLS